MLALRRLRCLLHSIPVYQTRHLRTRPRPIPTYTKQWNPTLSNPSRPPKTTTKSPEPDELDKSDEPDELDELPQTTLEQLEQSPPDGAGNELQPVTDRHSQPEDVVIRIKGCSLRVAHAIKRLEYLLNRADSKDDLDPALRAPLWNAYLVALKYKVSLPKHLPRRACNILWRSQYADGLDDSSRKTHLVKLDRDLATAQAFPVAGQVAYRIEQKFMAGMQERALEMWAASRDNFATAPDYLDTGVRLYGLAGHPDQAHGIMDYLFRSNPTWNPSVMSVVLRAYTSKHSEQHLEKARAVYIALKQRMGTEITIKTYDSCMIGFLEARSLPDAKQVFEDMARTGWVEAKESRSHVAAVIRKLNLLYALGTDISSMSSIALSAITVLPTAYHGHVFSDWMKSAMVAKAPQAAAQILDLMIQRGYQPETDDFNRLLTTLFRTKEPENLLKAEDIGWKMIEEARQSTMPTERHPSGSRVDAIANKLQNASVLDANPGSSLPPANPSTFALIMRHHASNSQWEHVDYLIRQLKLADVKINTPILNVLLDIKCQKGLFSEVWQVYKSLTDNSGEGGGTVFPDGQTIRILWRTLRLALSDPANREDTSLPTPRELLRETLDWWILVRQRPDFERFRQGLASDLMGAVTKLVLHSFSYAQDLPGTLVALHFLNQKFKIQFTRETAVIVFRQLAWKAMHNETESVRRQFGRSQNHARTMQKLSQTYEHLARRRLRRMKITMYMLQSHNREQRSELELEMISEFIRVSLLVDFAPETVENLISSAAEAAGVPYIYTGDMDVFDLIDYL
ncbi:hypothetical protein OPT61_g761 [Boeremia exigua]|uniref:Uncharacterized protein n=1 Tax=Boeremia exigua TaxID=749465 RepID=A0ACC2ISP6_9PLEO|nr:hypothetical protein OPT61_g761 [Boeremia exigua]